MTKSDRTILITALIIAAVLAFWIHSAVQNSNPSSFTDISGENNYIISSPHYGPLVQMKKLDVVFQSDNTATGVLPYEKAQEIKENKKVVLYDSEGFTLPLGGRVSAVTTDQESTSITIVLPEKTNTNLLLNEVSIITLETIASKRLSKNTIQTNENGETFVWIATPDNEDQALYKASPLVINVGIQDKDYFEEDGFKIKYNDLVVLDPDENLTQDNLFQFKLIELNAPLHNPIKQAWINFELKRMAEDQKEMIEAAENCSKRNAPIVDNNSNNAPVATNGDSCGTQGNPQDAFVVFQSLINNPNGQVACDSGACPQ